MRAKEGSPKCLHTGPPVDEGIVTNKSRINREIYVRFHESLWVKGPVGYSTDRPATQIMSSLILDSLRYVQLSIIMGFIIKITQFAFDIY